MQTSNMIFINKEFKPLDNGIELCVDLPIATARELAKASMKAKLPFIENKRTSATLGADMCFYATLNQNEWHMVLIKGEFAKIIPIPSQPFDTVWYIYRHTKYEGWHWWSMGYELPMMIESFAERLKCTECEITATTFFGKNIDGDRFALRTTQTMDDLIASEIKPKKELKRKQTVLVKNLP